MNDVIRRYLCLLHIFLWEITSREQNVARTYRIKSHSFIYEINELLYKTFPNYILMKLIFSKSNIYLVQIAFELLNCYSLRITKT